MKNLFIIALVLMIWQPVFGQRAQFTKAEKYFQEYQYAAAVPLYESVLLADAGNKVALEHLALSFVKLNDAERAEPWLEKLCAMSDVKPDYVKLYSQVLASNKKYEDSKSWYGRYLSMKRDPAVASIVSAYNDISSFHEDSVFMTVRMLPFNSPYADFSPAFYGNDIVFCSARPLPKKKSTHGWNNASFIDLYRVGNDGSLPVMLPGVVNSHLHEGPAAFTSNLDTIFFTRNNLDAASRAGKDKVVKLMIYYAVKRDGIWQQPKSFPLNNEAYSIGHPALARDGKLYFVSDMPGGYGGTDIYWTTLVDGNWIKPINLGSSINTAGNEMFPFVDNDGTLYFASNYHPGLGGLDIFSAAFTEGSFDAPKNLGAPVNSSRDDFGLIIRDNKGYMSSNRGSDPKDDNIFEVEIRKTRKLVLKAVDKTGSALDVFDLVITRDETAKEDIHVHGDHAHSFNADHVYDITCLKARYVPVTKRITKKELVSLKDGDVTTMTMEKANKNLMITLVSPEQKPLSKGKVTLRNKTTGEVLQLETDERGVAPVVITPDAEYEIEGAKTSYRNRLVLLTPSETDKLMDGRQFPITLLLPNTLFEKNEIGQLIEMDIKYDVNKATIRKDAAKELDRLVVYLTKNPNVKVELGSHTDSRGSNEANHKLSQKRAASAAQYLVTKGISSLRIIPVGYGEEDLKVLNAVTEEDHQQNRRTTVKIVGI